MDQAQAVVGDYLATLQAGSLHRQRRWALTSLLTHAQDTGPRGPLTVADLLDPGVLGTWLAAAATGPPPASTAGLRARAAAVRALAAFASAHQLTAHAPDLVLPAPEAAHVNPGKGRALLVAACDGPPPGIRAGAWARFAAHTLVVGTTGAGDTAVAALTVRDVDLSGRGIASAGTWTDLPEPAVRAVGAWLTVRTQVVATLAGSDPGALWVRVAPATGARAGARPAGLALTGRGLRKAFAATVQTLGVQDPAVAGVSIKDVRAAAGTWGLPGLGPR